MTAYNFAGFNRTTSQERHAVTPRISRNAAQCAACQEVIESTHRHDYRSCSCGTIFVDGGKEYLRRGGDLSQLVELSEHESFVPLSQQK